MYQRRKLKWAVVSSGQTWTGMESLICAELDLMRCLLSEVLVFWRAMLFYQAWFSYLWKNGEKRLGYCHICEENEDTERDSHSQCAREATTCALCASKKRVFRDVAVIVKWLQACFPLFSLGPTRKLFHNASEALCTDKLTSRNRIAWLFLLLQPNKQHITSLIVTWWTLLETPAYLGFEKKFQV